MYFDYKLTGLLRVHDFRKPTFLYQRNTKHLSRSQIIPSPIQSSPKTCSYHIISLETVDSLRIFYCAEVTHSTSASLQLELQPAETTILINARTIALRIICPSLYSLFIQGVCETRSVSTIKCRACKHGFNSWPCVRIGCFQCRLTKTSSHTKEEPTYEVEEGKDIAKYVFIFANFLLENAHRLSILTKMVIAEKRAPLALPTEMLTAIFKQIDSPITAVCFSLANKKCREIFKTFFYSQFPGDAHIQLLSDVEYCADGTRIKLCSLLMNWFGKSYAFYDPYRDMFVRHNRAKKHLPDILESIADHMIQYTERKKQEWEEKFGEYEGRRLERERERQQKRDDYRDMRRCGDPDYDSDEYVDSDEEEEEEEGSISDCDTDGGDPETLWLRLEGYNY